jgi:hypothetical protein
MPANAGVNQQLSELIAKIEIEQNPGKFNALVEELNRLLDGDHSGKNSPATPKPTAPKIDDPYRTPPPVGTVR